MILNTLLGKLQLQNNTDYSIREQILSKRAKMVYWCNGIWGPPLPLNGKLFCQKRLKPEGQRGRSVGRDVDSQGGVRAREAAAFLALERKHWCYYKITGAYLISDNL